MMKAKAVELPDINLQREAAPEHEDDEGAATATTGGGLSEGIDQSFSVPQPEGLTLSRNIWRSWF